MMEISECDLLLLKTGSSQTGIRNYFCLLTDLEELFRTTKGLVGRGLGKQSATVFSVISCNGDTDGWRPRHLV